MIKDLDKKIEELKALDQQITNDETAIQMNVELEQKIRDMMSEEYKKFITEKERLNQLKNDMI